MQSADGGPDGAGAGREPPLDAAEPPEPEAEADDVTDAPPVPASAGSTGGVRWQEERARKAR